MILLKVKKASNNETVLVKPVFHIWYVGLEFKDMTGYGASSYFCNRIDKYIFPTKAKVQLFFIRIWYWVKMWLWFQIRRRLPNYIKRKFRKKLYGDLPF